MAKTKKNLDPDALEKMIMGGFNQIVSPTPHLAAVPANAPVPSESSAPTAAAPGQDEAEAFAPRVPEPSSQPELRSQLAQETAPSQSPQAGLPRGEVGPREPRPPRVESFEPVADGASVVAKRKMTLDLTEEVAHALYERQLELRTMGGLRAGQSTIGWVADQLLRKALGLPALTRVLGSVVQHATESSPPVRQLPQINGLRRPRR